jgi:ribonuclease HI
MVNETQLDWPESPEDTNSGDTTPRNLRPISPVVRCEKFIPPNPADTPNDLFEEERCSGRESGARYVRKSNPDQIIIYVKGACRISYNPLTAPSGGCACIFRPQSHWPVATFCLERQVSPERDPKEVRHRAELRAVIFALQVRRWSQDKGTKEEKGEGWKEIVIATGSNFVLRGATEFVECWPLAGWHYLSGKEIEHRDLWIHFLEVVSGLKRQGITVLFWRVPLATRFIRTAYETAYSAC